MKILWIPQISSKSSDGKILLNKDSNMSVLTNLVDSELWATNEIEVAFEFAKEDCIFGEAIEKYFVCHFNNKRHFTNAYMERFCFDYAYFESIKESKDFDIVFVNEPTKVIPLRKIFNCKVVTYIHWLAFKNMPEILYRQLEGINNSDICFVNSQYAIDELKKFYGDLLNANLVVAEPTFRDDVKEIKQNAKMNFIYNHRLSSDKYYANALRSLFGILEAVEERLELFGIIPIIYFTNPSGKNVNFLKWNCKVINIETQEQYNNFLASNEICGHLNTFFESEGMWSMSTVDCAINGNVCLLPKKYGYAEIFEDDYEGYCENEKEMIHKMINLIYDKEYRNLFKSEKIKEHSARIVGKKMNEKMEELLNEK